MSNEFIESSIYLLRGQRVMLDSDLSKLYGVSTKRLNEQVKRNLERFPEDFMFRLSEVDVEFLRSQFATSSPNFNKELRNKQGGRRYLPYAFTEQGVAMLSSVLRSPQAIAVNVQIMRTFIKMRRLVTSTEKLGKELREIKSFLLKNSQENMAEFKKIWAAIDALIPPPEPEGKIGFKLNH